MDELSCSSISYSTDAAAAATITTNGYDDDESDFRRCLNEDASYNAIADVVAEGDGRDDTNNINNNTTISAMDLDLVPPPPPHIELLDLSTDAIVKTSLVAGSSSSYSFASSHTGNDDTCNCETTNTTTNSATCIAHVISYLDDDSREFARVSCTYLRDAVDQFNNVYIQSLPSVMTPTDDVEAVGEVQDEEDEEKEQSLIYLQDLLREQQMQKHQHHHSLSSLEYLIDARETIPSPTDERSVKPLINGINNCIQTRLQPPSYHQPASQPIQLQQQVPHHEIPPTPTHHQPPQNFRYAGESLSSSFKTESLDDSTLLSSYPQQTIMEEDDEESWELNPIVQNSDGRREEDDSVDIDVRDCMTAAIIERKLDSKNEEGIMEKDKTTKPDILAQFSDAMLYGDTPPVLSQLMSGIVDSAKLAVSNLYHHQHHRGSGSSGGIGWRNRFDDDDGVDDAGPIKIGGKYYSHNEALRRWRRAKVKLEDRYHGIDMEGNVKMDQTTYFEKSSLFQDRDTKGEKINQRNYWDGGMELDDDDGEEEKVTSTQENNAGEGDVTSMSIDHLVTNYAMIKKEAKVINPAINDEHEVNEEEEAKDEIADEEEKDNFKTNSSGGYQNWDVIDVETAASTSLSSSPSWDSLPTTAPPPPAPEQPAQPTAPGQNMSNTTTNTKQQSENREIGSSLEEGSVPTDTSRMSSPGMTYNFIGGNTVRKDCEQSVLGSQYGMEVLLKMPKKAVAVRKPRTLASHNFGVAKVVSKHGPVAKQNEFIWTESGGGGANATTTHEAMPPSPLRSQLKNIKSSSWTNRTKSNPQSNSSKILPLKLKLGMKKSSKS